jgi:hypothetical protein
MPLCWQPFAPSSAHSFCGSVPFARSPQTPSAPEPFKTAEQALHVPAQAWSQQTPSTQNPLMHCEADEQGLPFVWSLLHVPLLESQNAEATQIESFPQVAAHLVESAQT